MFVKYYSKINSLKYLFSSNHSRTAKYRKNSLFIVLFQVVNILANFLLVTIVLQSLGIQNYGVWVTLTTITSWFGFLDIGLAHGLRNRYAEANAVGDIAKIKGLISSTFYALVGIGVVSLIPLIGLAAFLDWASLLNAPQQLAAELKIIAITMILAFNLRIVLNMVAVLKSAEQEPFINNVIGTSGNLLSLIFIFILIKLGWQSFLNLGIILVLSQVIPFVIAFIYYFATTYRAYLPRIEHFSKIHLRSVFGIGYKFFLIQIFTLLIVQSNILIIAHICGPSRVTEYNVAYKYLWPLIVLFTAIIIPLWSASTEAYMKGDMVWLKSANKNLKKVLVALIIVGLILLVCAPFAYKIWLKSTISVDIKMLVLIFIYFITMMWYSIYRMFMNGVGKIKLQFIVTIIQSTLHVPLAILAASFMGVYGVLVVMILWNIINCVWEPIQYYKIIDNRAKGLWNA